jgi:hypothetical protein
MSRNTLVADGAASPGMRLLRALPDRKKNTQPWGRKHKVLIELLNADHKVFHGQFKTVTFTVPDTVPNSH